MCLVGCYHASHGAVQSTARPTVLHRGQSWHRCCPDGHRDWWGSNYWDARNQGMRQDIRWGIIWGILGWKGSLWIKRRWKTLKLTKIAKRKCPAQMSLFSSYLTWHHDTAGGKYLPRNSEQSKHQRHRLGVIHLPVFRQRFTSSTQHIAVKSAGREEILRISPKAFLPTSDT